RSCKFSDRKRFLELIVDNFVSADNVKFSSHIVGNGRKVFSNACKMKLEGIVSKLASSNYHSGRSSQWLKIKCIERQEFVIGGYTLPKGGRTGFGALLLGVYSEGELQYCGRVGTGFNEDTLIALTKKIK